MIKPQVEFLANRRQLDIFPPIAHLIRDGDGLGHGHEEIIFPIFSQLGVCRISINKGKGDFDDNFLVGGITPLRPDFKGFEIILMKPANVREPQVKGVGLSI